MVNSPVPSRGEVRLLASDYTDEDLLARWEEFFEATDYRVKIIEVADQYPEQRSVYVAYDQLDLFDPDMAEYVLQHPVRCLHFGRQAMAKLLPPGRERAAIQLRMTNPLHPVDLQLLASAKQIESRMHPITDDVN